MTISVAAADYRTAPLKVRERLVLDRAQARKLLHIVAAERIFAEALILSTCNRTEIYFAADAQAPDALPHALEHLAEVKGERQAVNASLFRVLAGPDAARHLLRVA